MDLSTTLINRPLNNKHNLQDNDRSKKIASSTTSTYTASLGKTVFALKITKTSSSDIGLCVLAATKH